MAAALVPQVETLVVVGREWGGLPALADLPRPGLGPLGGLAAALAHARATGHEAVLSAPCDTTGLPSDLAARLAPGPAVATGQWLVGLWPTTLADRLLAFLGPGARLRARDWIVESAARSVEVPGLANLNRPPDPAFAHGSSRL